MTAPEAVIVDRPVSWGILGPGRIATSLARGARLTPETSRIVAVASRDQARARLFADEFGVERVHGTYGALLADPAVEAVYITLPNSFHHPWTMRAIAAGKHVLCEKPYTRRPAEVEEAFDAAERAGVVLSEGFMWRHRPQTRRLLELLPRIGELRAIQATFSFALTDPHDLRAQPTLDGGSLMDVGCYCVSAARLLAGEEPQRVSGEQVIGQTGVDVRFAGILRFPSGVLAEFVSGFDADHVGLEAIGSEGSISVPEPFPGSAGRIVVNGEAIAAEAGDPYRFELEDLAAAIRGRGAPLLGRADAIGQARTIAALYRSAETGVAVEP